MAATPTPHQSACKFFTELEAEEKQPLADAQQMGLLCRGIYAALTRVQKNPEDSDFCRQVAAALLDLLTDPAPFHSLQDPRTPAIPLQAFKSLMLLTPLLAAALPAAPGRPSPSRTLTDILERTGVPASRQQVLGLMRQQMFPPEEAKMEPPSNPPETAKMEPPAGPPEECPVGPPAPDSPSLLHILTPSHTTPKKPRNRPRITLLGSRAPAQLAAIAAKRPPSFHPLRLSAPGPVTPTHTQDLARRARLGSHAPRKRLRSHFPPLLLHRSARRLYAAAVLPRPASDADVSSDDESGVYTPGRPRLMLELV